MKQIRILLAGLLMIIGGTAYGAEPSGKTNLLKEVPESVVEKNKLTEAEREAQKKANEKARSEFESIANASQKKPSS